MVIILSNFTCNQINKTRVLRHCPCLDNAFLSIVHAWTMRLLEVLSMLGQCIFKHCPCLDNAFIRGFTNARDTLSLFLCQASLDLKVKIYHSCVTL